MDLPPLAYGCWRFAGTGVDEARAKIETAVDAGITLIDTADIYGIDGPGWGAAETLLGQVFAAAPGLRERCLLVTKGGIRPPVPYDQSRDYLVSACEDSLRRLRVDRLDVFMVHRPDLLTHPEELAGTLATIVERGLAAEVGVSNFSLSHTRSLAAHLPVPLAVIQPEFSPLRILPLDDGTLDWCAETGTAVLAWSPLAGGRLLTGEGVDHEDREALNRLIPVLDEVAEELDTSRTAVILAWIRAHPTTPCPIIGTQNPERIASAATAAAVQLDRTQWYRILTARRGAPLP